ncbi:MAG TPA: ABC transporter permease [Chloroflexota bacterium]|nr:ABC transporter permease [Chloroflexota bacterium]
MTAFARALWAELYKLRRTLALAMVLIAPLFVACLQALLLAQNSAGRPEGGYEWATYVRGVHALWALLMLPLVVSLETTLLGTIEHQGNHWKHLFALPIPRWSVYLAKFGAALGLLVASSVLLGAGAVLCGVLLRTVDPGIGLQGAIPWWEATAPALLTFLAAWLIVAIHTWVALRWPSIVVGLGLGIAATVAGVLIAQSGRWGSWFPWSLPVRAIATELAIATDGGGPHTILALGIGGGLLVALLGCWEVTRRDVT